MIEISKTSFTYDGKTVSGTDLRSGDRVVFVPASEVVSSKGLALIAEQLHTTADAVRAALAGK